jgi:hypothetical protein
MNKIFFEDNDDFQMLNLVIEVNSLYFYQIMPLVNGFYVAKKTKEEIYKNQRR